MMAERFNFGWKTYNAIYMNDVLLNYTLETYVILLTNVTLVNFI